MGSSLFGILFVKPFFLVNLLTSMSMFRLWVVGLKWALPSLFPPFWFPRQAPLQRPPLLPPPISSHQIRPTHYRSSSAYVHTVRSPRGRHLCSLPSLQFAAPFHRLSSSHPAHPPPVTSQTPILPPLLNSPNSPSSPYRIHAFTPNPPLHFARLNSPNLTLGSKPTFHPSSSPRSIKFIRMPS